jgi:hypothetical protein
MKKIDTNGIKKEIRRWTGDRVRGTKEDLEDGAATLLGKMLFEFSRLDMALGLCLVWSNNGQGVDELTAKVEQESFAIRVNRLEKLVLNGSVEGSNKQSAYVKWIEAARRIRAKRNSLVHGRWGTDLIRCKVINVVGLPTSPEQRPTEYSLLELENILTDMKELQDRLTELRKHWPL